MASDGSVEAHPGRPMLAAAFMLVLTTVSVTAADLRDLAPPFETGPNAPRYFPRGDGSETAILLHPQDRRVVRCLARQVPVPTNAPSDPSYVGSEYGLGKPSYYGFTPPRGVDDPFGRSLLPYCR